MPHELERLDYVWQRPPLVHLLVVFAPKIGVVPVLASLVSRALGAIKLERSSTSIRQPWFDARPDRAGPREAREAAVGLAIVFVMAPVLTFGMRPLMLRQFAFTFAIPLVPMFHARDGQAAAAELHAPGHGRASRRARVDGLRVGEGYALTVHAEVVHLLLGMPGSDYLVGVSRNGSATTWTSSSYVT